MPSINDGVFSGVKRALGRFREIQVDGVQGALNPSRYRGATQGGSPTSGTFRAGDWVLDLANAAVYTCTASGAPGTWRSGAYVPLPSGGTVGQVPAITGTGTPPTMAWTTPGSVASYKTTIGDGATKVFTLTHSLNDLDVAVTVWDLTLDQITYPTVGGHTNVNQVTVTFSVAPTLNQMRVIVGAF